MKSSSKIIVALVLIMAIMFAFFNCKHVDPPGPVTPEAINDVKPAAIIVAESAQAIAQLPKTTGEIYTAVKTDIPLSAPAMILKQQTKNIQLSRIDFSGVFALPEPFTFHDVLEVYVDGKPVDRSRVTVIEDDRIDIWDARLNSRITALVQY
ncbi:MAG: hypothetical protein P4N59_10715 [Negativicutes bacterium]|nr:hypothetical protein [Negativicutes bacterium]